MPNLDVVTLPDGSTRTTHPSGYVELHSKLQVIEEARVLKLRQVAQQAQKDYLAAEPACDKSCADYAKCPCHKCVEFIKNNPLSTESLSAEQYLTLKSLWDDKTGYLGGNGCKIAETLGRKFMPLGCLTFICPFDTDLAKYETVLEAR